MSMYTRLLIFVLQIIIKKNKSSGTKIQSALVMNIDRSCRTNQRGKRDHLGCVILDLLENRNSEHQSFMETVARALMDRKLVAEHLAPIESRDD